MDGEVDGWIDEWINSMGSFHTVEYYRTKKRRENLTQATTGMDPEHTPLSERGRHRRTQCVTPLIGNAQNRQVHRDRKWLVVARGLGEGRVGVSFGDDGNVLQSESGDYCTTL